MARVSRVTAGTVAIVRVREFGVRAPIAQAGRVRVVGRIETTPQALELFAASLAPSDRVALEITGDVGEVARILAPYVASVVVVSPTDTGNSRARQDRPP